MTANPIPQSRKAPATATPVIRAAKLDPADTPESTSATPARSGRSAAVLRELLEAVHREVAFAAAVIVTTAPRGGLQVIAPEHASETLVRGIGRIADGDDRVTWSALLHRTAATSGELWTREELAGSAYEENVLRPNGLDGHVALPIESPLLPGYHGALVLFRETGSGDFTADEVAKLTELARGVEQQLRTAATPAGPLPHELETPMIVFGPDGQILYPSNGGEALARVSDRLRSQVGQAVSKAAAARGTDASGKRVVLPDDRGDLWAFRVRRVESYPALTGPAALPADTPVIFLTHMPNPADYAAVSSEDVAADDEVARLVPALRFMFDEHRNGPTLEVIARHVHLSPFHFHRRFTELLGLTPKHYLFDCQIDTAKRQLVAGEELAEIAKHCGFAHQSHFTSRFKQATGLTPTRWRKLATA